MSKEDQKHGLGHLRTAEYPGGKVGYAVFGQPNPENHRIMIIPGFTEDSLTMEEFAKTLAETADTEVIVPDQPGYLRGWKPRGLVMSAINHFAEAYLAVIEAEDLEDEPLDVVAHSLGAPVEVRMAELAKDRGVKALDFEEGSQSVFMAPAGTNPKERLLLSKESLAARFLFKFLPRDAKEVKKFEPSRMGANRAARNFVKNPFKSAKETWYLSKKSNMYPKLGRVGLKPHVMVFSDDPLLPQRLNQPITEAYVSGDEDYSLAGWSSAANVAGLGKGDSKAEDAWLDDYRHAGHNDHGRHPQHVAQAVLQLLNQG